MYLLTFQFALNHLRREDRQRSIHLRTDFYKAAFGSTIFIYVVSLITILANSLFLLIFCIDPLKIFRNSTTYFLIGLAIVDLLTALVQEPIYATCFIILFIKHPSLQKCLPFMDFAFYFSAFSIMVSLSLVPSRPRRFRM